MQYKGSDLFGIHFCVDLLYCPSLIRKIISYASANGIVLVLTAGFGLNEATI